MKVAVVGAGVSGLTAAYLLSRAHDVELFEREPQAGGHAHTVTVREGARDIGLDTGFIVYNDHTYPQFTRLLRELGVPTQPGDMSLGVSCRACHVEYSSRGIGGMLAQPGSAARPGHWLMAIDVLRFYRDTRRVLQDGAFDDATLGAYLRSRRYSGGFVRHFIIPLAAAVWSTPPGDVREFPVRYLLRFLHNHGIIGLRPALRWRTVSGGSRHYVERMLAALPNGAQAATPVVRVQRTYEGAHLRLASGECRAYDEVVLACHADEALALLGDASDEERRALGAFRYTKNAVILHTDASLLPRRPHARASWNYVTDDCRATAATLAMTYHLNRLQDLRAEREYCVSLNTRAMRPDTIIREMTYEHPQYTFDSLAAQKALRSISGRRHTHYAGAHLGHGFHEDGVVSGMAVAAALGVRP